MRSVIFDLDGTLADTSGDLIAAANSCLEGLGCTARLDPVTDAGTALRGGRAMLTLGLEREFGEADSAILDSQYTVLLEAYESAIDHHTTLYPFAMEAIEALKSDGYRVGICTNKPEYLAEILMQKLGVRDAFDALIGADTLPVRKPDPAPYFEAIRRAGAHREKGCLVGDTITDHSTARAANAPSILVTFGPGQQNGQADIRALQPDALLDRFEDLPDIVARLLAHH